MNASSRALIIVDVQNDFCPGGALAVSGGDAIIPGINRTAPAFGVVVTTQDWHPQDHGSFASNHIGAKPYDKGKLSGRDQVLWPDHCVQDSKGAALHPALKVKAENFPKGTNPDADSYSGFFDDDGRDTGLDVYLKSKGIKTVYVCGLATDYCVKFTAMDAVKQGYQTVVLKDLCRAVNLAPGDEDRALGALQTMGVKIQSATEL